MTKKQYKFSSQLIQSHMDERMRLLNKKTETLSQIAKKLKLHKMECEKYPCKDSGFCFCIPDCLDFDEFCMYDEDYKIVQELLEPIEKELSDIELELHLLETEHL